jgi:hypothetical protein
METTKSGLTDSLVIDMGGYRNATGGYRTHIIPVCKFDAMYGFVVFGDSEFDAKEVTCPSLESRVESNTCRRTQKPNLESGSVSRHQHESAFALSTILYDARPCLRRARMRMRLAKVLC